MQKRQTIALLVSRQRKVRSEMFAQRRKHGLLWRRERWSGLKLLGNHVERPKVRVVAWNLVIGNEVSAAPAGKNVPFAVGSEQLTDNLFDARVVLARRP